MVASPFYRAIVGTRGALSAARLVALVLCSVLSTIALTTSGARAETSAMTDAFVASVGRTAAVLRQADTLADGAGTGLRRLALRDLALETESVEALAAWARAERNAAWAAAHTPSIDGLGPLLYPFDAAVVPLDVDGRAAAQANQALLARLAALHGADFDALYAVTHVAGLRRLEAAYVDYIKNGDDPALRRISVQLLPRTRQLVADLSRR